MVWARGGGTPKSWPQGKPGKAPQFPASSLFSLSLLCALTLVFQVLMKVSGNNTVCNGSSGRGGGCGHRAEPRLPGPCNVSLWLCKNNPVALLTSYYYPSLAVRGLSDCVFARPLSCWPPLALEARLGHLSIRLALSEALSEEASAFLLQLFLGTWAPQMGPVSNDCMWPGLGGTHDTSAHGEPRLSGAMWGF